MSNQELLRKKLNLEAQLRRYGVESIDDFIKFSINEPEKWQEIADEIDVNNWLAENAIVRGLTVTEFLRMVVEREIRE